MRSGSGKRKEGRKQERTMGRAGCLSLREREKEEARERKPKTAIERLLERQREGRNRVRDSSLPSHRRKL